MNLSAVIPTFAKAPFAKKTVDGVMSAFNQTIADLNEVQQREIAEAERLRAQAAELMSTAAAAEAEANRAGILTTRLNTLIAV